MNVGESWKMYITVSERKETCRATDATPLYRAYHGRQAFPSQRKVVQGDASYRKTVLVCTIINPLPGVRK